MSVWTRRMTLAMLSSALVWPRSLRAEEVIDLEWDDLLPEGETTIPRALRGLIEHDGPDLSSQQPPSSGARTDWNGRTVRLQGFIVPIDFEGTAVTAFILVPFVGACIHVPPPPANQLVFVTTEEPYDIKGLYSPVNVTGILGVSAISTHVAQIGYALSAEEIEPFRG